MTPPTAAIALAFDRTDAVPEDMPAKAQAYPEFRYMGAKQRLLPWIHSALTELNFDSALDPFCGSGSVAYLMKAMGKRVVATDFLNMATTIASATVANNRYRLGGPEIKSLLQENEHADDFIARTFDGIFFSRADLQFLDRVMANLDQLDHPSKRALAKSALIRSCLKRQPRGVFTVSGDLSRYDDGRRDLRLSIEEHFLEQIEVFNATVFDNGRRNYAVKADFFEDSRRPVDLVYLDPPYVPRSDDNCYIKRYHFLEGLSTYWEGEEIDFSTKVRKIKKRFTPFSYRRTAIEAFDQVFRRYAGSMIVLSYSSNGFPDLDTLRGLLAKYSRRVEVLEKPHRYHFGTHKNVSRALVTEYLIIGWP